MIGHLTHPAIKFGTFLIILLFGFVISIANTIFEIKKLHYALKLLIHYTALLLAFIFVFIIAGNIKISGAASVFSAIIIFTFLYGVIYALSYGLKAAMNSPSKSKNGRKKQTGVGKKAPYKPLYKNDDKK
jgi:prepilin signal peptidase PulO-like enzyme (type II secretory pathway)